MKMRRPQEIDRNALLASYERQPLGKIFVLFKPYRKMLVASFLLMVSLNMVGLTLPWMLKIAIDRVLPNADYLLFWVLCLTQFFQVTTTNSAEDHNNSNKNNAHSLRLTQRLFFYLSSYVDYTQN